MLFWALAAACDQLPYLLMVFPVAPAICNPEAAKIVTCEVGKGLGERGCELCGGHSQELMKVMHLRRLGLNAL